MTFFTFFRGTSTGNRHNFRWTSPITLLGPPWDSQDSKGPYPGPNSHHRGLFTPNNQSKRKFRPHFDHFSPKSHICQHNIVFEDANSKPPYPTHPDFMKNCYHHQTMRKSPNYNPNTLVANEKIKIPARQAQLKNANWKITIFHKNANSKKYRFLRFFGGPPLKIAITHAERRQLDF